MKFDAFFSICQTEVDGYTPSERVMFENFFDQLQLADELGYGTAWLAETHLSCQVQKQNPQAVIPHFKGEIGLNTDILQMAHVIFARTKNIEVGSAIRNILCNGGPIANAEAIKTFLSLHGLNDQEKRRLHLGFASGRFEFSNIPYGIKPRNRAEKAAWPVVKGKILNEATEIMLRFLRGDVFCSKDVAAQIMMPEDFRSTEDWNRAWEAHLQDGGDANAKQIPLRSRWEFDQVGVIPFDAPLRLLNLVLGSHDPKLQEMANKYLPVSVFNLSITPPEVIEQTHERMRKVYHPDGGTWQRDFMPRTALIYVDDTSGLSREAKTQKAKKAAEKAWATYWTAMEGTLDPQKVEAAVGNTLAGSPEDLAEQIKAKYHPDDRLMLWFDFNNHNNQEVKSSMRTFMEKVAPLLN
ncbi:MAG: LLM class flavin-dependent oxidoreductase [Bdellovibrionaceae bacterium]|nr:LLM class flavin-dependent oxidoreductase [Bdellovibrionales bacterium]MCB9083147.1 LLM class flavin-dependent oxidoreductase [Pseudobdellovibrionaceae bacterium]